MAIYPAPAAVGLLSILMLAPTLLAQTQEADAPSAGVSKVRIVRISEVRGVVQADRANGRGFEAAIANLPIVENSKLRTGEGVAEVEFEDNSTLRLAPYSEVEFPRLERLPGGATASSVHLLKGTAYVSLIRSRDNQFTLLFGQQKLNLPPASHVRLQMGETDAKLAVLEGNVTIDGPTGAMDVPHKKTVTFSLENSGETTVAKDVSHEAFDSWDHESTGYHARSAMFAGSSYSPYSYGVSDMMYYGSFMDAGGCGSMWRPYFASAAWDPYSNGAWSYYQGAGYSWVSPYPWGWTPYHTGSWNYCQGMGWGWQPGGGWNGLNNVAAFSSYRNGSNYPVHMPKMPVKPPGPGAPTLIAVNLKPLVRSEMSPNEFVFRKDSAGLGVPRQTLGKLSGISRQTVAHGTASTPIYMTVESSRAGNGRMASRGSNVGAVSIHHGYAPSAPYEGSVSRPGYSGGGGGGIGSSGMSSSSSSSAGHASGGPAPSSGGGSHAH